MEGRGTLRLRRHADRASPATSAPTRTGPTASGLGRSPGLLARPPPELDGKVLPTGFGVAVNPTTFENIVSQVALGGKARVGLDRLAEHPRHDARVGARLPGRRGAPARRHDADRGLGPDLGQLVRRWPTACSPSTSPPTRTPAGSSTTSTATCPASTAPCRPRSGAPTSRAGSTWASPATSRSSPRARPSTDPYKPAPDELYARGKAHFDAGRFAEAGRRARAALRRLHAPRRRRQGRRADAPADQHQGVRAAQDRPVLRGRQGEGPRADPHLRPVAGRSARPIATSTNTSAR